MNTKNLFTYLLILMFLMNINLNAQENEVKHTLSGKFISEKTEAFDSTGNSKADPIASFPSPGSSSLGIDYDIERGGFWLACEDGHTYLIDPDDGSVLKDIDLEGIAISTSPNQNGLTVLPSGNILYADYRGDASTIDDYLFEIDPDEETLVNYWPLSGSLNTSTDGTSIENIIDVEVYEGFAYVTTHVNNNLYRIQLEPGMPGTWSTSTVIPMVHVDNILGVDMFCGTWIISDGSSTNVAIVDPVFSLISTIDASHDGNFFNSGVCFYDGTDPAQFAVIDWSTNIVAIYDSEASIFEFPSIDNITGETVMCPNQSTTLTVEGTLNDAENWFWFTESCGGTAVFEGESFTTPPVNGEISYYVRGEGGCVTIPEACEEITVVGMDDEEPQINCPPSTEVVADNTGTYTVPGTDLDFTSASDNCELESLTNNYNNLGTLEGAILPMGTTIITWTATDESGNMNNCMFTVQVTDNSSIGELAEAGFKAFPNPSAGMLKVQHDFNEVIQYTISDVYGKVVYEKTKSDKNFTIDLTKQIPGVYLLNVKRDNEFLTGKILIN